MPKGSLRISLQKGRYCYYNYDSEDLKHPEGKYIKKKDYDFARQLAQKAYIQDLIDASRIQLEAIDKFANSFDSTSEIKIFSSLSECRKKLVTPVALPDDLYISNWYEEKRAQKDSIQNSFIINNLIRTERGEMVRSKSEKMIADKLLHKKIPYVYECPLTLIDGTLLFPDFILLDVKRRHEIYYEHFGMIDVPEYARNAIEKIRKYEMNGYIIGQNLIVSFETKDISIDTNHLGKVLDSVIM